MKPRRRKTAPIEFPETKWHGQVVDVLHKRRSKRGHISRFLANPRLREKLKGQQAKPTRVVKDFAKQFPGKDLNTVRKVLATIRRFKIIRVPIGDLEYFYARRTAEDVIGTKTVIALDKKSIKETGLYVHGCVDHALAAIAILRAKEIKADFVREDIHSWVWFELEGKKYRADPSYLGRHDVQKILEISPGLEKNYEAKMKAEPPKMVIKRDAWDAEVFSIGDYLKYASQTERRKVERAMERFK